MMLRLREMEGNEINLAQKYAQPNAEIEKYILAKLKYCYENTGQISDICFAVCGTRAVVYFFGGIQNLLDLIL